MSENAIILPDETERYMSVDLDDKHLKICLFNVEDDFIISLDPKILPHLVDALIELQNRK